MTETIQVLARKSLGFKHPEKTLITPEYRQGVDIAKKGVVSKLDDAYFIIPAEKIGKVVVAPAWIQEDKIFGWAVADGDLMVVNVAQGRAGEAQAQALADEDEAERLKKEQAAVEAVEAKKAELALMNKADLIDHAKEQYGLELSPAMKKDDLADAILKAHMEGK